MVELSTVSNKMYPIHSVVFKLSNSVPSRSYAASDDGCEPHGLRCDRHLRLGPGLGQQNSGICPICLNYIN